MTSFFSAVAASARRRPGLFVTVSGGVLAWHMAIATGVSRADYPTGAEPAKPASRDGAYDAVRLVALESAAVGSPGVSSSSSGSLSGSVADEVRREARPKFRPSTGALSSSLAQVSLRDGLVQAHAMDDGVFGLSRSVVPLLTPQSLAASGQFEIGESLRGAPVGGTAPMKFRSAIRLR